MSLHIKGCFPRVYRRVTLCWPHAKNGSVMLMSTQSARQSTARKPTGSALLLAMPIVAFGLGTWQVYRLQWKKDLIQQLNDRTMQEPIVIDQDSMAILTDTEQQYRRVRIKGTFDHTNEIHLFPRCKNNDDTRQAMGVNPTGAQIITPLRLSHSGEQILVNRGWVEKSKMNPEIRPEGQVMDEVEIVAFIRQGEKRAQFVPSNNIEKNHWHYRDVDEMAQVTGSLPILVDADAGSTVAGGPIGGQTRVTLRNEHLQYIITWYGLSIATTLMYYQFRKPGRGWR